MNLQFYIHIIHIIYQNMKLIIIINTWNKFPFPCLNNYIFPFLFLFLFCSSWLIQFGYALELHTLHVNSLLPHDTCSLQPFSPVHKRGASLQVVHRHGPCAKHSTDKVGPTHRETLLLDEARVASIRNRVTKKSKGSKAIDKDVVLPAISGSRIGSGNYFVKVGLGTPKKDLSLIFDTGSDLTWTQCEPCVKYCYKQQDPTFNPSLSSSYANVSCTSPLCTDLSSATGSSPHCSSSTCVYGVQYGDSSYSVGFFARDLLSLSRSETIPNFLFGCGQNNRGLFGGSAGLLGLGRDKISVVMQTEAKYGKYFSYCLPPKSSSTGHLAFGPGGTTSKAIKYTPMRYNPQQPSFYFVDMQGIAVAGKQLSISPTVFSSGGTLIDSGTVITRLPPDAYSSMRAAFRQGMSQYPAAPALSILDTCYDLSRYSTVSIPKISLLFRASATVDLGLEGIMYVKDLTQVCLAFAGNEDATDVVIVGNTQQLGFDVVYDVAGGKIGFGPGGCS